MCDSPVSGFGGIATTDEGIPYYTDTAAGHTALAAEESRDAGPSILAPHEGPPEEGVAEDPTPPEGCEAYTDADFGKLCSKYFRYSQMKMKPTDQVGLTAAQVACNWQKLCQNVLDPIKDAGFNININSGFRTLAYNRSLGNSSTTSDHLTGCAADLSAGSIEQNKALFKWVGKNLNPAFTQIIFEGRWVHVSHNGRSSAAASVLATRTGRPPYLNGGGKSGSALPPDLRWA